MKKIFCLIFSTIFFGAGYAQFKVGTNTKSINLNSMFEVESKNGGILSVNKDTLRLGIGTSTPNSSSIIDASSTTMGFLPPRMTKAQRDSIANPALGLLVYCTNCTSNGTGCLAQNNGTPSSPSWECIGASAAPSVSANCNGFVGNYYNGVVATGDTFRVTITNNSFTSVTIGFSAADVVLSGIMGLSVGSPIGSPALSSGNATLAAGGSVILSYPLTGTPAAKGMLSATFTKLGLTCSKAVAVTNKPPVFNCNGVVVNPNNFQLTNGSSYSGTITVPYTATAAGEAYPAQTITSNGISFTRSAGTYALSGTITYTISGTYTGATNATFTITFDSYAGGCSITIWDAIRGALAQGGCASCSKYDTATVNSWINITAAEYDQLAALTGSYKGGCNDIAMGFPSTGSGFGGQGYSWLLNVNGTTINSIPIGQYVYAIKAKQSSYYSSSSDLIGAQIALSTGQSGTLTQYGNNLPSSGINPGYVYFVMKRPSNATSGIRFLGAFNNSNAGNFEYSYSSSMYWNSTGAANGLTQWGTYTSLIQSLSTSTKQW